MIEFSYNAENDKTNEVEYFDTDGRLVDKYSMMQFKLWCDRKYPDLESTKDVDLLIDENWIELTTEFYNSQNN